MPARSRPQRGKVRSTDVLDGTLTAADFASTVAGAGLLTTSGVIDVVNATNGGLVVNADDMGVDINDLAAAVVDVAADSIAIYDSDGAVTAKESIADLATGMAGVGLAASAGVVSLGTAFRSCTITVDAEDPAHKVDVQIQITDIAGTAVNEAIQVRISAHDTEAAAYSNGMVGTPTIELEGTNGTTESGTGTGGFHGTSNAANGLLDVRVTDATGGGFTRYLRVEAGVVNAAGVVFMPPAISIVTLTWDA